MHLYTYTYIAYNVNIRKYIHKTIFAQKRKGALHYKNEYKEHKHGVSETSWHIFPYTFLCVSVNTETHRPYRETKTIKTYPLSQISPNPP